MKQSLKSAFAAMVVVSAASNSALAIDRIYSPNVVKGELELEYSGNRTFDRDPAKNNVQSHEFEAEYGLTNRLMVQIEGEYEKEPGTHMRFSSVAIGGKYQFFEQGANWLDSGLLLSYGMETEHHEPNAIEAKLLLEKQTGKFLHRANIGLEQQVGHYASGGPERSFLWSTRYLANEHFNPGFEIQSNFGKGNETNKFDEQEHYVGPAVYGKIIPGLNYEAGYFIGMSDAAAKSAARVLVEYELYF